MAGSHIKQSVIPHPNSYRLKKEEVQKVNIILW